MDSKIMTYLMAAIFTATLALMGWTINAVANMPKEYVLQAQFERLRVENREDHKEIIHMLNLMYEGRMDNDEVLRLN